MPIEIVAAFTLFILLFWLFIYSIDIAVKLDRQSSIALIVIISTLFMTIGSVALTLYKFGKQAETKNQSLNYKTTLTCREVCWLPKIK